MILNIALDLSIFSLYNRHSNNTCSTWTIKILNVLDQRPWTFIQFISLHPFIFGDDQRHDFVCVLPRERGDWWNLLQRPDRSYPSAAVVSNLFDATALTGYLHQGSVELTAWSPITDSNEGYDVFCLRRLVEAESTITKLGWNHELSALVPFPGRVFFALQYQTLESGLHE